MTSLSIASFGEEGVGKNPTKKLHWCDSFKRFNDDRDVCS